MSEDVAGGIETRGKGESAGKRYGDCWVRRRQSN